MIEKYSAYDTSVKKLLSYATSENQVNQEFDLYNQSQHRILYIYRSLTGSKTPTSKIEVRTEKFRWGTEENPTLNGVSLYKGASATVGCIGIEMINPEECEIKHIAVLPDQRGSGIGSEMIQFVCDYYSLREVFAETDKDAVNFYRNFGFKITSLGEKYPSVERFLCEYKTEEG